MVRRYRKRPTRPRRNRRRRAPRRKMKLYKPIGPPAYWRGKLKYIGERSYNASPGFLDSRLWALNSLYDPDQSGTGGQPYYFDELSALYTRYIVYACKVKVRCMVTTATPNYVPANVGIVPTSGNIVSWPADFITACQKHGAKWKQLPAQQSARTELKAYYPIHKIYGIPKSMLRNELSFHAFTNANPVMLPFVYVLVQNNDGFTAITIKLFVELTYYCKMYQPTNPDAS